MNPWKYEDYSQFSRQLAATMTMEELQAKLSVYNSDRGRLAESHHKAVGRSKSMSSNSQARAQTKNAMVGNYENHQAYRNAIEICIFFPEKTKEGGSWKSQFANAVVSAFESGGGTNYDALNYFFDNYC